MFDGSNAPVPQDRRRKALPRVVRAVALLGTLAVGGFLIRSLASPAPALGTPDDAMHAEQARSRASSLVTPPDRTMLQAPPAGPHPSGEQRAFAVSALPAVADAFPVDSEATSPKPPRRQSTPEPAATQTEASELVEEPPF
jgi:hypothetical protein